MTRSLRMANLVRASPWHMCGCETTYPLARVVVHNRTQLLRLRESQKLAVAPGPQPAGRSCCHQLEPCSVV